MLWQPFHWLVDLIEVIGAVAGILASGLLAATAAFWILSRSLGLLADPPVGSDPIECEYEVLDEGMATTSFEGDRT
jgi:hypothetical protein